MLKRRITGLVNSILAPLGVKIVRTGEPACVPGQPGYDASSSYMTVHNLQDVLIRRLGGIAQNHFRTRLSAASRRAVDFTSEAREFLKLYAGRPFKDNAGGSGFHNAFWLYLTARVLDPALVVESGVWKGHTTWLLRQACPDADILGFDIDLSRLEHEHPKTKFFEHDWSAYDFGTVDPDRSMIFFDCHVDHARRITESHGRGFRHLLFDDNPPAHLLYSYGLPGFPTANILWEGLEMIDAPEISWVWQGKEISYPIDRREFLRARELIKAHEVFPDVGGFTRYGGYSFLTFVNV